MKTYLFSYIVNLNPNQKTTVQQENIFHKDIVIKSIWSDNTNIGIKIGKNNEYISNSPLVFSLNNASGYTLLPYPFHLYLASYYYLMSYETLTVEFSNIDPANSYSGNYLIECAG
jgi:hypothetical protein